MEDEMGWMYCISKAIPEDSITMYHDGYTESQAIGYRRVGGPDIISSRSGSILPYDGIQGKGSV